MNSGSRQWRPSRGHEKDRAFLASLRTATATTLAALLRHYKRTPWRVVAIERELARRV